MITLQRSTTKAVNGSAQATTETPRLGAAALEHSLRGLRYPADRQQVIDQAALNGAPENIMAFYGYRLPERRYFRSADITFNVFMSSFFLARTRSVT